MTETGAIVRLDLIEFVEGFGFVRFRGLEVEDIAFVGGDEHFAVGAGDKTINRDLDLQF